MRGWKIIVRKLSLNKIKSQILISMIVLTFLTTIFLAFFIYRVSADRNYKMYGEFNESNMTAYSKMLDLKMGNFVGIVREQILKDEFLELLENSGGSASGARFDSVRAVSILPVLSKTISKDHAFSEIAVFDLKGHCQMAFQNTKNSTDYQKYYEEKVSGKEAWYQSAVEGNGKEVFWGCDVLNESNKQDISFVKLLKSTRTFEPVGVLVVAVNKKVITDLMEDWDMGQKAYSIVINDSKLKDGAVYFRGEEPSENDLYMACTNGITGWEIINAIPYGILNRDNLYIKMVIVVLVLSICAINIVLSFVVSRKINGPLKKLQLAINRMKEKNCGIEAVFDDGEIGSIGNLLKETVNYNLSLNTKLNEARIRERDAQLLLLQSQINPHFLYNTLDSLYCMAIIDNADDVAEMVSALSDMFKLSLIKGKRFLPLKEELEYVRKYMQIQNMRYKDRFDVVFSVSDEVEDCYILKFLIQPFVENAVYHGLEPKIGEGKIEIACWLDGSLCICVKDNGVGVEDCRQIENGYGINNVKERIRLFYGEEYGITIKSKKGMGTNVFIRIPPWGEEQYRRVMSKIKY